MRARRTDAVHREVLRALKLLGLPYRDLSGTGGGVQDLLVGLPTLSWVLVEVKTPKNKTNANIWASQYTDKQREWYAKTAGFPRLVVTGFADALEKLREMGGK